MHDSCWGIFDHYGLLEETRILTFGIFWSLFEEEKPRNAVWNLSGEEILIYCVSWSLFEDEEIWTRGVWNLFRVTIFDFSYLP